MKYHKFNVDNLVVSTEQSRKLPKYIDVYDNDGNIVTALQIHFSDEIEMTCNDNPFNSRLKYGAIGKQKMHKIESYIIDKIERVVEWLTSDTLGNIIITIAILGLLFQIIR